MNGGAEFMAQRIHEIAQGYEAPCTIADAYEDAWTQTSLGNKFRLNRET